MRNLSGLEAIAKALKEGEPDVRERWRCEEIDLRDCAVEKVSFLEHLKDQSFFLIMKFGVSLSCDMRRSLAFVVVTDRLLS